MIAINPGECIFTSIVRYYRGFACKRFREVLEAAELFGAGLWQRLRHAILPLKPSSYRHSFWCTMLARAFAVVVALSGRRYVTVLARETARQYYDLRNLNVAASFAGFI